MVTNKATIHRNNIRAWLQSPELTPNRRYDIDYSIVNGVPVVRIQWNVNGARKVSDCARGGTIDLNNKSMSRLFGLDVDSFIWDFDEQGIFVTAAFNYDYRGADYGND